MSPDIIALCETKRALASRKKNDDIPGFDIIERNCKIGKEGMMIAAKKGTFKSIEEVTESELRSIMCVRIEYTSTTLRIVLVHAPQETDSLEDRMEFFNEIDVQIQRCNATNDVLVLLGDFNARLSANGQEISPMSPNGKMLDDIVEENKLSVCNFSPGTTGTWTRIQKMKTGIINRSAIDYVLIQDDMVSLLNEMTIDEEKIFCPYRIRNTKSGKKVIYSDHCSILLSLDIQIGNLPNAKVKHKRWNFTEEGFEKYKIESMKPIDVKWTSDSSSTYENWLTEFEKVLHRCFTKKTVQSGTKAPKPNKGVRGILGKMAQGGKIQRKVVSEYRERIVELERRKEAILKAERLKQTMALLTDEEKFSPNGYWKLKKAADRKLKTETTSSSVIKENGVEVSGELAINQAYKDEFQHRLRTREPHDGWKEYVEETNCYVREWLNGESEHSPLFTMEELDKVVYTRKKGKSPGVDEHIAELFIHAGIGIKEPLLKLLNQVKTSREIPEQWNLMKIVTIYKQKGSKKLLKYYRGIFLATTISKIFESLIKNRINPELDKMNLLQAGSRSNRCGADNVFMLRGCVDHFVAIKQPLYITAYDYEQAFDSLWVEKCILALKNLGVSKEMLQLIYNLNKKARVVVKTPHGLTTEFETEPLVKQGTVLGSAMCSSSTAEYCGRNEGVPVGDVLLSSLLYVDDAIDVTDSVHARQNAHNQAVLFTKENNLSLSGTKCFEMAMNTDEDLPVLSIDNLKHVIPANVITYLGDAFNKKGDNTDLMDDRVGRGTKASNCITALIKESYLGKHEVSVWLLLYRSLFLSTVLFNSEAWSKLSSRDLAKLSVLQMRLLKKIMGAPTSTTNSFVLLELGVLPIEAEIYKRQLMYLHRILQLETDDPVYKMFLSLTSLHEKGEKNWWTGVKDLLAKYNLPPINEIKELSRTRYKKLVSTAINDVTFQSLKDDCAARGKTSSVHYTTFGMQKYLQELPSTHSKIIFRSRCKILDLKTHRPYNYVNTTCRKCHNHEETLDHVLNCGEDVHIDANVSNIEAMSDSLMCDLSRLALRVLAFYNLEEDDGRAKRKLGVGQNNNDDGLAMAL